MTEVSTIAPVLEFPKVALTGRAFDFARSEGITGIEPDIEVMLRIGELAGTGELYIPDLTILRAHAMRQHDQNIHTAPDTYNYLPASELGRPIGEEVQSISARELRRGAPGRPQEKRLELTVNLWADLGRIYVTQVVQARTIAKGGGLEQGFDYAANAVSLALRAFSLGEVYESTGDRVIREAASLKPYILHRRTT